MTRVRLIIPALVAVLALGVAAPAFAQSPPTNAYGGDQGKIGPEVVEDDIVPPPSEDGSDPDRDEEAGTPPIRQERGGPPPAGGDLPFTGFEAGLVALLGAALLGAGVAMRRSARRPA